MSPLGRGRGQDSSRSFLPTHMPVKSVCASFDSVAYHIHPCTQFAPAHRRAKMPGANDGPLNFVSFSSGFLCLQLMPLAIDTHPVYSGQFRAIRRLRHRYTPDAGRYDRQNRNSPTPRPCAPAYHQRRKPTWNYIAPAMPRRSPLFSCQRPGRFGYRSDLPSPFGRSGDGACPLATPKPICPDLASPDLTRGERIVNRYTR